MSIELGNGKSAQVNWNVKLVNYIHKSWTRNKKGTTERNFGIKLNTKRRNDDFHCRINCSIQKFKYIFLPSLTLPNRRGNGKYENLSKGRMAEEITLNTCYIQKNAATLTKLKIQKVNIVKFIQMSFSNGNDSFWNMKMVLTCYWWVWDDIRYSPRSHWDGIGDGTLNWNSTI